MVKQITTDLGFFLSHDKSLNLVTTPNKKSFGGEQRLNTKRHNVISCDYSTRWSFKQMLMSLFAWKTTTFM